MYSKVKEIKIPDILKLFFEEATLKCELFEGFDVRFEIEGKYNFFNFRSDIVFKIFFILMRLYTDGVGIWI